MMNMKMNTSMIRGFHIAAGIACVAGIASVAGCASTPPPASAPIPPKISTVRGATPMTPVLTTAATPALTVAQIDQQIRAIIPMLGVVGDLARVQGDTVHCKCVGGPQPEVPTPPRPPGATLAIQNAISVLSLIVAADSRSQPVTYVPDASVGVSIAAPGAQ